MRKSFLERGLTVRRMISAGADLWKRINMRDHHEGQFFESNDSKTKFLENKINTRVDFWMQWFETNFWKNKINTRVDFEYNGLKPILEKYDQHEGWFWKRLD